MNRITKVGIHNIFTDDETAFIDVDSPITIFTGYNGIGKSTALGIIHSTISLANRGEYLFPRSNWASQIFLLDGRILNHGKVARPVSDDFSPPQIKNPQKEDSLKQYFTDLNSRILPINKKNKTLVSKDGEKRDLRSTNVLTIADSSRVKKGAAATGIGVQSLLYCDELFNFNQDVDQSERLEELDIFSKKNTLDKTLYLLIIEFSMVETKTNFNSELHDLIKQIDELFSDSEMPLSLRERVEDLRSISTPESSFLTEVNIFFSMTGREIFYTDEKMLQLRVKSRPKESVEWFNLSKGEKTLLCLLLAAYLNKDKDTVFLLDEPDLSLHIKWQKQLLKSLRALAPKSQFIISTHSPAMIGNAEGEKIINVGSFARVK
ncbi:AAA family ATPase [Pseudomonas sp. MYb118]|uniref:AAA family ATPase n=1 Tax=Pseudomonas sp. MYb118 TaxID=1848720 RepID=UPI0034CE325D